MKVLAAFPASFDKPFFVYGKNDEGILVVKSYPTVPEVNSESVVGMLFTDIPFERGTIEEVMAEFDRLGFVMPEESETWDFQSHVRLFISDTDLLDMLSNYPDLIPFIDIVKDTTIKMNRGRWIYLSELYPQHKLLFSQYPSFIYEEQLI